ncbi:MAG: methionine--tRNA ligase, partial [Chloroflexota bacterium]
WVTLSAIAGLKTMMLPFIPFSAQKLHHLLGFPGKVEDVGWTVQRPVPGHQLPEPNPLFRKLDDSVAEEETQRMPGLG